MSAKTTAQVNIVNADLFVSACEQVGIKTTHHDGTVTFGNYGGIYHKCTLKYDDKKQSFMLDGDSDTIADIERRAFALYNCIQLQSDLEESGRFRVIEDSMQKVTDEEYRFRVATVTIGG